MIPGEFQKWLCVCWRLDVQKMNFAILVVIISQVELALSCTFQREDVLRGKYIKQYTTNTGAGCFAACLTHMKCTGLCYGQVVKACYHFADGDEEQPLSAFQCYSLHRDLVKPPQYTRKLSFIKKGLRWMLA